MKYLKAEDPEIAHLILREQKRQENTLMMIPSENIVSFAVEEAIGSCLGNKYAEGYPFKRYYQGQAVVDKIETIVIERAKKMFNVPYANVQPLSGSPANLAVYTALCERNDTIMGLSLAFGGHLTHGASVSITGKFFKSVQYGLTKYGIIDYEQVEKLTLKERPKIIVSGTTAYSKIIDWERFAFIAKKVNAYLMADISHIAGLIVAKVYPSPVPYADIITTTTHKTLRGPRGAMILVTEKGIRKDEKLPDKINKAVFPGLQGGPHMNTIAGIGVALKEASTEKFKIYAQLIVKNAKILAQELILYEFNIISGGTDSHLMLIDLQNKKLMGKTVAEACEKAGIILNYNAVPYDPNPPFNPSGIRLGTPGITSRGMKEKEMLQIAHHINQIVQALQKTKKQMKILLVDEKKSEVRKKLIQKTPEITIIARQVSALCDKFPIKKT